MFSTSADVLNLVLSGSVILLTIFICWALYNVIISVQRINKISKIVETGVIKVEEVVNVAKDKLRDSSAYFMILAEVAKKAIEFVKEKRCEKDEIKKEAVKKGKKK
jgi:hypothetical protein